MLPSAIPRAQSLVQSPDSSHSRQPDALSSQSQRVGGSWEGSAQQLESIMAIHSVKSAQSPATQHSDSSTMSSAPRLHPHPAASLESTAKDDNSHAATQSPSAVQPSRESRANAKSVTTEQGQVRSAAAQGLDGQNQGMPLGSAPRTAGRAGPRTEKGSVTSRKQAALERLAGQHPQLFRALQSMKIDPSGRISPQSIAKVRAESDQPSSCMRTTRMFQLAGRSLTNA